MKNKIIHDTIILTVITIVAGFLLGLVHDITKKPIADLRILSVACPSFVFDFL